MSGDANQQARERYANDPEYREKCKAKARARWANDPECRAKHAARARERYAKDPEQKEKIAARKRNRYASDQEFRAKKVAESRERYASDPEYFASWHRKRKYGLDEQTYRAMLEGCRYRCPICKTAFNDKIINLRPVVDHCHRTGRVRGILCQSCNFSLSHLMDDPKLLLAAVHYLKTQPQLKEKLPCL